MKDGDELVALIVLRTDRGIEYIHLADYRGGTELVNVLSQSRLWDILANYETTRDTVSHFFIDKLRKGHSVFEDSTRIVHKGRCRTGFAGCSECMPPSSTATRRALGGRGMIDGRWQTSGSKHHITFTNSTPPADNAAL